MTLEMADTGGLESDMKVGSEVRGDKIVVWLLCSTVALQGMSSAKISGKNQIHRYLMSFLLTACSYLNASNSSTTLIKGIENDQEKMPVKLHF